MFDNIVEPQRPVPTMKVGVLTSSLHVAWWRTRAACLFCYLIVASGATLHVAASSTDNGSSRREEQLGSVVVQKACRHHIFS
jgi:hypothetical protein